jgi:hypothetical protein
MAQNGHRMLPGIPIVLRGENPPVGRVDSQNLEEAPGRNHASDFLRDPSAARLTWISPKAASPRKAALPSR